jgi:transcriptional regulator with XRE-family HTH domain
MTPNGYMKDVAAAVRSRRRYLGVDQETVASLAGVSRKSVSEIERAKPTIRVDVLVKVLDAVGLEPTVS